MTSTAPSRAAVELVVRYKGWTFRLALGDRPVVMGRDPECEVQIPDRTVSGRHCRLVPRSGEGWSLEDLGSQGGTRVDGVALSSPPVVATFLVLVGLTGLSFPLAGRAEVEPPRQSFADFPMQLDTWHGQPMAMERQYIETLRFDDYLLADYQGAGGPVNVYTAYYHSQKKGQATHSPKTCIPGGGWEIASLEEMSVLAGPGSRAFPTNRVVIQKGNQKQIVYYWFKQRDRWITSEYLVKVFLFWDSITRNRTDGALVRLSSWVHPGENEAIVDERLQTMAGLVTPLLGRYVPD